MSAPLRVGIAGALGRMGRAVAAALETREGVSVAALIDRPGAGGPDGPVLANLNDALDAADVVIDFSTPDATADLVLRCTERGCPALVIGTTGLSPDQDRAVAAAAERLAIVRSGNFSLGVNLLVGLVRQAARALPDYDIEVFEAHHRRKLDAPSGTALMLGRAAARGRGVELSDVQIEGDRAGQRPNAAIGFSVLRAGGIVGEHSVVLAAEDEILTLSHSARDRSLFARGAVEAALWVAGKPPGLYGMAEVLGLDGPDHPRRVDA